MANFFATYDLNGPHPTHQEMDDHLEKLGLTRGRVLETVWYISYSGTAQALLELIQPILGPEDLLLVIDARDAAWTKILIDNDSLIDAWRKAA